MWSAHSLLPRKFSSAARKVAKFVTRVKHVDVQRITNRCRSRRRAEWWIAPETQFSSEKVHNQSLPLTAPFRDASASSGEKSLHYTDSEWRMTRKFEPQIVMKVWLRKGYECYEASNCISDKTLFMFFIVFRFLYFDNQNLPKSVHSKFLRLYQIQTIILKSC